MSKEQMLSNIGLHTRRNTDLRLARECRTAKQFSQENENIKIRMSQIRSQG